jgi:hypothetical protein
MRKELGREVQQLGAECPARDERVGLVLPMANTDAMLVNLEHISAKVLKQRGIQPSDCKNLQISYCHHFH